MTAVVEFGDAWLAHVTFQLLNNKLLISSLTVERGPDSDPSDEITADLLRSLKLGQVRTELREHIAQHPQELLDEARTAVCQISELDDTLKGLPPGRERRLADFEHFLLGYEAKKALSEAKRLIDFSTTIAFQAEEAERTKTGLYVLVALLYLDLSEQGWERGIIGEMANQLTRDGVRPTNARVKSWIERATKLDLLGPGTQGRAGRQQGPRLWQEYHRLFPKGDNDRRRE